MSNASLKEQLQALSLGSSEHASTIEKKPKKQHHHRPDKATKTMPKQKPAWLEYAQYGVELLKAHFPNCFRDTKDIQPLKKGIKQDLVKELSTKEEIVVSDKACMVSSLSYYVNSIAYHKVVVADATRFDLLGQPAGTVTAEEAQYSVECRKTKLAKKKPQTPNASQSQTSSQSAEKKTEVKPKAEPAGVTPELAQG